MTKLGSAIRIGGWSLAIAGAVAVSQKPALADQGGVSFWVPGFFGSLAAVPQQPGFNAAAIYYHTSVNAGGEVAAAKQIEVGRVRPNLNVNLNVDLSARADIGFIVPGYVFDTKVFGGQFAVAMLIGYGKQTTTLDGTLSASLGPLSERDRARSPNLRPVWRTSFRWHRCAGTAASTIS